MFGYEDKLKARIEVLELENEELLRANKKLTNELKEYKSDEVKETLKNQTIVTNDMRKEIIDYFYDMNVRADIRELANDIISILEGRG